MADAQLPLDHEVKDTLLRTDDGFKQLVLQHQTLDEQIHRLSSLNYLTAQEQVEEHELKKKKLALKDRIDIVIKALNFNPRFTGENFQRNLRIVDEVDAVPSRGRCNTGSRDEFLVPVRGFAKVGA
jgi:uncharacterized protein YdcH (DUF465 family)